MKVIEYLICCVRSLSQLDHHLRYRRIHLIYLRVHLIDLGGQICLHLIYLILQEFQSAPHGLIAPW